MRKVVNAQSPPLLLLLYSYIGLLWNSIVQILQNTKFWQNLFEFHKISWNLRKILQNMQLIVSQNFLQQPCCLLHKLPSAKTIFCCASMLLWDEADIYTIVFHYVIYNSVVSSHHFSACTQTFVSGPKSWSETFGIKLLPPESSGHEALAIRPPFSILKYLKRDRLKKIDARAK